MSHNLLIIVLKRRLSQIVVDLFKALNIFYQAPNIQYPEFSNIREVIKRF